ncbi:Transcriptional regulator, TetR family [Amycolatopsis sp. YIM 10]|nr:Transcriptional regulator, TetR family [Amycolatopsis sp. YIM 10]
MSALCQAEVVSEVTSFTQRAKASLREELLVATTALLIEKGYAALRMVDVATRVGVSRQTLYNEFGTKAALVEAVALRTTAEFLDGIHQRFDAAPELLDGVRAATVFTIEHARENPLVAAALGTGPAEDLLPLLTTRAEPVLRAAADAAAEHYRSRAPWLGDECVELLAETVVRLNLSHLVLPTHSPAEAADQVCAVIAPAIEKYSSSTME